MQGIIPAGWNSKMISDNPNSWEVFNRNGFKLRIIGRLKTPPLIFFSCKSFFFYFEAKLKIALFRFFVVGPIVSDLVRVTETETSVFDRSICVGLLHRATRYLSNYFSNFSLVSTKITALVFRGQQSYVNFSIFL